MLVISLLLLVMSTWVDNALLQGERHVGRHKDALVFGGVRRNVEGEK